MKQKLALALALFAFTMAGQSAEVFRYFFGCWRQTVNTVKPEIKAGGGFFLVLSDDYGAQAYKMTTVTTGAVYYGTWFYTGPGRVTMNATNPDNGQTFTMRNSNIFDNQIEGKHRMVNGTGVFQATRQAVPVF